LYSPAETQVVQTSTTITLLDHYYYDVLSPFSCLCGGAPSPPPSPPPSPSPPPPPYRTTNLIGSLLSFDFNSANFGTEGGGGSGDDGGGDGKLHLFFFFPPNELEVEDDIARHSPYIKSPFKKSLLGPLSIVLA